MNDAALTTAPLLDPDWSMSASEALGFHGSARRVALSGAEALEARERGGDGMALSLGGGHARARDAVMGKPWSLCVRACDPSGRWDGVMLSVGPEGGPVCCRLSAGTSDGVHAIRFELTTDFRSPARALVVTAPLAMIGIDGWRDIVVRYSGPLLELFVDGVLLDEEWPAGDVARGRVSCWIGHDPGDASRSGFGGSMARCDLWARSLGDGEVAALSGGVERAARREREILGPARPFSQYWRPPGHRTGVGDCMPFFHDGRFHLFYLIDRHGHASKYGLGAHQWAHVSTSDLKRWEEHPLAIAITEEWEGSICTGSVFAWEGVFHAFYATRTNDGSPAPLQVAISADGIHFRKHATLGFLGLPYRPGPARDPVVFQDGRSGLFHMLVTSELAEPPVARHGGCLAHLVSSDLERWEQRAPFIVPGYSDQPECPDHFTWNGWSYLVFSNHGVARYRMSRDPLGPWRRPDQDAFDGPRLAVMKTAAFTGGRRIGAAFLSHGGYGGEVVFREIIQHDDGTLGTAFPREMEAATAAPLVATWSALGAGATVDAGETLRLSADDGFAALMASGIPDEVDIRMTVHTDAAASAFGVCLRTKPGYSDGYELRIEPARRKVGWRRSGADAVDECERDAIHGVTGLDRPFTLAIAVRRTCIDVCVDGRRTLVVAMPPWADGDALAVFAHQATVAISAVEIRPVAVARS